MTESKTLNITLEEILLEKKVSKIMDEFIKDEETCICGDPKCTEKYEHWNLKYSTWKN